MNEMKFTYLLGAGASCEAIPAVNKLRERMLFQRHYITDIELKEYSNGLSWLIKEIPQYTSIDTYAKFLFLKEDHEKLNKLKNTLTLFFIIEQSIDIEKTFDKGEGGPSTKDPDCIDPNILHLNGIAGVEKNKEVFFSEDFKGLDKQTLIEIWKELSKGRGYNNFMKFAWESDNPLELVSNHLLETDILVVIGYSFPYFNRKVDNQIFENLKKGRLQKIYFQNTDEKLKGGEFLRNQFNLPKATIQDSVEHGIRNYEIEGIFNGDRFHIPLEY